MSESAQQTFLIVGAGQAGGECAVELRKRGFAGRIVIIGDEAHVPYRRPPLSKAYFAGSAKLESLYVMPQASLDKHNIEVLHGVRVDGIDRARKTVALSDGRNLSYDKLALTTGGRARPLNLPGASRPNVFLLRSIADVDGIRAQAQAGKCMVVVGGGFIGLETAAVAAKLRLKVTVLEGLPRVLARVTVPEVSEFFERAHREAGVDLRTGVQVTALEGEPNVTHVVLDDGTRVEADFVVVGIGLIPNTELAQAAGLAVNNGIVVDQFTQTEDPDIVAAGDCTNHPSDFAGRRLRLESVQNAMEQGRAAAHAMLGKAVPYQMVPWFWSDQYDLKLQMVGLSTDFEQMVLRGDPATQRSFATFYLRDGVVIAADAISRPQDFMLAKKMVAARLRVDPAQLADESVALKTLVP
jgi:3-phenylpropionate/trans-cinnamate dioxygenase ferredoxin reductase component